MKTTPKDSPDLVTDGWWWFEYWDINKAITILLECKPIVLDINEIKEEEVELEHGITASKGERYKITIKQKNNKPIGRNFLVKNRQHTREINVAMSWASVIILNSFWELETLMAPDCDLLQEILQTPIWQRHRANKVTTTIDETELRAPVWLKLIWVVESWPLAWKNLEDYNCSLARIWRDRIELSSPCWETLTWEINNIGTEDTLDLATLWANSADITNESFFLTNLKGMEWSIDGIDISDCWWIKKGRTVGLILYRKKGSPNRTWTYNGTTVKDSNADTIILWGKLSDTYLSKGDEASETLTWKIEGIDISKYWAESASIEWNNLTLSAPKERYLTWLDWKKRRHTINIQ